MTIAATRLSAMNQQNIKQTVPARSRENFNRHQHEGSPNSSRKESIAQMADSTDDIPDPFRFQEPDIWHSGHNHGAYPVSNRAEKPIAEMQTGLKPATSPQSPRVQKHNSRPMDNLLPVRIGEFGTYNTNRNSEAVRTRTKGSSPPEPKKSRKTRRTKESILSGNPGAFIDSNHGIGLYTRHISETLNPELDAVVVTAHIHSPEQRREGFRLENNQIQETNLQVASFLGGGPVLNHAQSRETQINREPVDSPTRYHYRGQVKGVEYDYFLDQPPPKPEDEVARGPSRDINRLNQEIDDQRKEFRIQIEGLQRQLDREDAFITDQKTDNDIFSLVSSLRGDVQTFAVRAAKMFKTPFDPAAELSKTTLFEEEIRMVIPASSKSLREIFDSVKGVRQRRFFIQGWVHLALWKYIFTSSLPMKETGAPPGDSQRDLWLSETTSNAVNDLEKEIARISMTSKLGAAAFHKWRALTLSILHTGNPTGVSASDHKTGVVAKRCQEMAEVFQELRESTADANGPDQASHTRDREENLAFFQEELANLFETATMLSSILRTQKAGFEMRFPQAQSAPQTTMNMALQTRLLFNSTWMEINGDPDGHGSRSVVDYVIEPALFKSGNANGERYDIEAGCFMKAVVACLNLPPLFHTPSMLDDPGNF
ncbi:hypothetical protein H072_7153 [Dactylellina haptotyla CBS 200.50]|uniref:Uncharacterized protein n=1 Tax=Dactylellina haptotyla (strain CBS 200.50) TaxID=1284197 RepID=S8A7S1_DACHA|nr:hypothetical protein H072_7153 [Dactylellina haptotyla CBS 200.50]